MGCLSSSLHSFPVVHNPGPPLAGSRVDFLVTRVIDGDTIEGHYMYGNAPFYTKIRVYGIDTPEKNTTAGVHVTKLVEEMCLHKIVTLHVLKWDKFGGRVVGDVLLTSGSLSQILLEKKLAHSFETGRKPPWESWELQNIVKSSRA